MNEHLVRHGSKHKIQVHTTKRNKQQQKLNRTHFQNKNNEKPERRSLTKTKARGKNENGWVQQTHTLTHIHRHALAPPPTHPPTHTPTHTHTHTHTRTHTHKIWGKGGEFDRHTFYKTSDKKMGGKTTTIISLYVHLTSEFTHNKKKRL